MAEFISKLQYKTYEKGEFSDEKARSLEETIQLIKNFPWEEQRGSDIQLTGPSVTIQNEYVEYLKLGLYFNGKFCLYFYDRNDHLFELHEPNLEDACQIVTDFFNGLSIEEKFDKHFFSIGPKSHFETSTFEYRVNNTMVFFRFLLMIVLSGSAILGTIAFFKLNDAPFLLLLLDIVIDIICLQAFYFMVRLYLRSKNMYLNILRGRDEFQFGIDNDIVTYSKREIESINTYGQTSRSSRIFNLMEVIFKNGSAIIIPGIIIEPFTLAEKFLDIKINYITKTSRNWKMIWNFSK